MIHIILDYCSLLFCFLVNCAKPWYGHGGQKFLLMSIIWHFKQDANVAEIVSQLWKDFILKEFLR